jgi:hypothetical protein
MAYKVTNCLKKFTTVIYKSFNLFRTKQTFSKKALYAYTNIKFDIQNSALSIIKLDALA